MTKKILIVQSDLAGMRLDKFLARQLESFSRTKINKLIDKGEVSVNGRIKKSSFHIHFGEKIEIILTEEKNELPPFKFAVNIIYEDEDILVVDKPQNLVVHPPQKKYYKTLVNVLIGLNKKLARVETLRAGIVHRLDKETSGLMVLAKNEDSYQSLVSQFKERRVKKEYCAMVWGEFKEDKITIDVPLRRDEKHRLKMKVALLKSKTAYTQVEMVEKLSGSTFLKVMPHTGRMHQIRVHLKFLGFPIVGDKKYGVKDDYQELFLHARVLGFQHPRTDEFLNFKSSLPDRFKKFINEYRKKEN